MGSQRRVRSIGDRELALLRVVGERRRITVGEAAEAFGRPHGLARSTVLTMMERLRRKGHLGRRQVGGVFQYFPRTPPGTAVRHAVQAFVDGTLGGSISPFVTYLAERERLSDDEVAELEALLDRLQQGQRTGGQSP
jgi:predicted transcriptional regulator